MDASSIFSKDVEGIHYTVERNEDEDEVEDGTQKEYPCESSCGKRLCIEDADMQHFLRKRLSLR